MTERTMTERNQTSPRVTGSAASGVAGSGFELIFASKAGREGAGTAEWASLPLPAGISYVALPATPDAAPVRSPRRRSKAAGTQVVLEPLSVDGQGRLLAIAAPELGLRINGLPAPSVALLRLGDELHVGGGPPLYVTEYRSPRIEVPSGELLDRSCAVCRLSLTAETRVYICSGCGCPMHLEGPEVPVDERLTCCLLGDCPCGAPVSTESGYAWRPEA